jgi:hypothetical protein
MLRDRLENYERYQKMFGSIDKVGCSICKKMNEFARTPSEAYEFKLKMLDALDSKPGSAIVLLSQIVNANNDFAEWIVEGARYSVFGVPWLPDFWNDDEMRQVLNDAIELKMLGGK